MTRVRITTRLLTAPAHTRQCSGALRAASSPLDPLSSTRRATQVTDIALPTQEQARALTDRIRVAVEGTWHLITEAYTTRAWAVLGYATWDAYCAAEFGNTRLRLPLEERQEVVASLRDSGLSVRAIASATGVGYGTVTRDLAVTDPNGSVAPITGVNGKTYTVTREPGLIDAETADESARPEPPVARRRPLPEAFTDAGRDLNRAAERLTRLTEDDRFRAHRETTHRQVPELLGALERTTRLLQAMDLPATGATAQARHWWAAGLNKIANALADIANALEQRQEQEEL